MSIPRDRTILDCDIKTYNTPLPANEELFDAIKCGDLKTVKDMLENKKADINVSDKLRQSALMWASWQGHYEVIDYLLDFDLHYRKSKKTKGPFLNYSTESKEKYNPLFCLVMSNAMQIENTLRCIKKLIDNEKQLTEKCTLLAAEDYFNENILHKVVRTGRKEYLDFFIEACNQTDKDLLYKLIDRKNSFSETPLILAVKLKKAAMVKRLIEAGADILVRDSRGTSLSVLALDGGYGDYETYLEVMKAKFSTAIDEERKFSEGVQSGKSIERHYVREDSELREALSVLGTTCPPVFWTTFLKFEGKDPRYKINAKEELAEDIFQDTVNRFFALITKQKLTANDIAEVQEQLRLSPHLLQKTYRDTYKTALQLSIERGNTDLFTAIFEAQNVYNIHRVSPGAGDYLIWAILHNQPAIIEKLLAYNSNSVLPENIMSADHSFNSNYSDTTKPTKVPLVQFLRTDNLRNNRALLERILAYYESNYNKQNYAWAIYEEVLAHNDESLLLLLYECSDEKNKFYQIDRIDGRPLHFILLEKNFFTALEQYIKLSGFDEKRYKDKDKNSKLSFQDALHAKKDIHKIMEIITYLQEAGIYK